jgi:hypothetical protein
MRGPGGLIHRCDRPMFTSGASLAPNSSCLGAGTPPSSRQTSHEGQAPVFPPSAGAFFVNVANPSFRPLPPCRLAVREDVRHLTDCSMGKACCITLATFLHRLLTCLIRVTFAHPAKVNAAVHNVYFDNHC